MTDQTKKRKPSTKARKQIINIGFWEAKYNDQLAFSICRRIKTVSKSGGVKNSLRKLHFKEGFCFLGAGGHVNLVGILASSPVGVVEHSSSPSPSSRSVSTGFMVNIGFKGLRNGIPAMTHFLLVSAESYPTSTTCCFSEKPIYFSLSQKHKPKPLRCNMG